MKKLSDWKKKPDGSEQYTEVADFKLLEADYLIASNGYNEFDETLYIADDEAFATILFEGLEDDLLLTDLYEKERSARVIAFGIQLDEMWSFVGEKSNKKWIWLAINPLNRQIVGFHIGGRGQQDAQAFMDTIPDYFKKNACFFTDYWAAYACVIDPERHFSVGKDSGLTAYIERFNNTLRQRASRLVRKGLSFSKSIDRHIEAIKYFICHYNLEHVALHL